MLHVERIAGSTQVWSFDGGLSLQRFLADQPWEQPLGQVRTIEVDARERIDETMQWVEQLVRGADLAGALTLRRYTHHEPIATVEHALHQLLGVNPEVKGRRRLDTLALDLRQRTVWLLGAPEVSFLQGDLEHMVDNLGKLENVRPPLVLLLSSAAGPHDFDLRTGWPIHGPIADAGIGLSDVWSHYVHWRIAWEVGGQPVHARAVSERVWPGLEAYNDPMLEDRLTDHAKAAWRDLADELKASFLTWLDRWPREDVAAKDALAAHTLQWHAPERKALGPLPMAWAARCLLHTRPDHPKRPLLRTAVSCEPLRHHLSARANALETGVRAWAAGLGHLADGHVTRLPDRSRQQSNLLVPANHPARAEFDQDHASLGDLCQVQGLFRYHRALKELARVRNALAHGHPPTWKMVRLLCELGDQLPH